MSGFRNIKQFCDAVPDGKTWTTQFRKAVGSAATITSSYIDYSYFAGSPPANFYASTPLESAEIDLARGIYVPQVDTQYLQNITVMSASSSATSTANQRQKMTLVDYLMYYPFFDSDAVGEDQDTSNTITLPRYSSGQVICIAQSASSAIGQFTFTYTNQDGVSGQVSPTIFTQIVAGGGQSANADISGGGFHPYLPLAAGDSSVKSIERVNFTVAGGGLLALVIVKPLKTFFCASECRRETTGTLNSVGAASWNDSITMQAGAPEIKQGARLGIIAKGNAGSLASSTLIGTLTTVWS